MWYWCIGRILVRVYVDFGFMKKRVKEGKKKKREKYESILNVESKKMAKMNTFHF